MKVVLTSDKYVSLKDPLKFLCGCGEESSLSWDSFREISRVNPDYRLMCRVCQLFSFKEKKRSESSKRLNELVMSIFKEAGAIPLFDEYLGKNNEPLPFICVCGKTHSMVWMSIQGHGSDPKCPDCQLNDRPRGESHPSWNPELTSEDRENNEGRGVSFRMWSKLILSLYDYECFLTNDNGRLTAHHLNSWSKYPDQRFVLNNGVALSLGTHEEFHKGSRHLNADLETFYNWSLEEYDIRFEHPLGNTRIDILVNSENLLKEKKRICEQEGWDNYVPFFLSEVISRWDAVSSMVRYRSDRVSLEKIGARKLDVVKIDSHKASWFLNKNHIHGGIPASEYYGLTDGNQLYAVMTFSAPRFSGAQEDWELSRFAIASGYSVPGAASKLFQAFVNEAKPKSIYVFSDRRFAPLSPDRSLYVNLGFIYDRETNPSYWYLGSDGVKLWNRQSFMKSKLKDKLERFDENLTEKENMELNGYQRFDDCGSFRYVWGV